MGGRTTRLPNNEYKSTEIQCSMWLPSIIPTEPTPLPKPVKVSVTTPLNPNNVVKGVVGAISISFMAWYAPNVLLMMVIGKLISYCTNSIFKGGNGNGNTP